MASSRATAVVTIVDDDDSYREALGSFIRSLSFDVQSFASAGDFLAAPRPTVSHCLILDYEMPGMSGLALQRRLEAELMALWEQKGAVNCQWEHRHGWEQGFGADHPAPTHTLGQFSQSSAANWLWKPEPVLSPQQCTAFLCQLLGQPSAWWHSQERS